MHLEDLSEAHILLFYMRSIISKSLNLLGGIIHEVFSKGDVSKVKVKNFIFPKMIDELLHGSCASEVYVYSGL